MIVAADLDPVQPHTMNYAGGPIGDEQAVGGRIEGQSAERRAGIRRAVERDVGEQ